MIVIIYIHCILYKSIDLELKYILTITDDCHMHMTIMHAGLIISVLQSMKSYRNLKKKDTQAVRMRKTFIESLYYGVLQNLIE